MERQFIHHTNGSLGSLVKVLLRQPEQIVVETMRGLEIAFRAGEKHPRIQQPREAEPIAALHHFQPGFIPLAGRLRSNRPILLGRTRGAQKRGEHLALVERKGGNVDETILELGQRFLVKTQQAGHSAPALQPGTGVETRGAVVEENGFPLLQVETVALWPAGKAEFIPEAAADPDPGALAQLLNVRSISGRFWAEEGVITELLVGSSSTPFIGNYPRNIGFGSGFDELGLLLRRSHDAHGDDERLVAGKGFDQRRLVVVVDLGDLHAFGQFGRAVSAGNSGDCVLARFEERFGNEFADLATSLHKSINYELHCR